MVDTENVVRHVEVIGTPGAGKTTLLPDLVASLWPHGFETVHTNAIRVTGKNLSIADINYGRGVFQTAHRRLEANVNKRVLGNLLIPRSQRLEGHLLHWWVITSGLYGFFSGKGTVNKTVILDEGLIQRLVSCTITENRVDTESRKELIENVPMPLAVIHVRSEPSVCADRLIRSGRLSPRFQGLSHTEITRACAVFDQQFRSAASAVATRGVSVIEISGEDENRDKASLHEKLDEVATNSSTLTT